MEILKIFAISISSVVCFSCAANETEKIEAPRHQAALLIAPRHDKLADIRSITYETPEYEIRLSVDPERQQTIYITYFSAGRSRKFVVSSQEFYYIDLFSVSISENEFGAPSLFLKVGNYKSCWVNDDGRSYIIVDGDFEGIDSVNFYDNKDCNYVQNVNAGVIYSEIE